MRHKKCNVLKYSKLALNKRWCTIYGGHTIFNSIPILYSCKFVSLFHSIIITGADRF